jgi:hypothetical protein
MVVVGGPVPDRDPLPGQVIATGSAGSRYAVSVGQSGRFTISLPPGTYDLAGYSPLVHVGRAEQRCLAAHPVQVMAGKSVRGVDVVCSIL